MSRTKLIKDRWCLWHMSLVRKTLRPSRDSEIWNDLSGAVERIFHILAQTLPESSYRHKVLVPYRNANIFTIWNTTLPGPWCRITSWHLEETPNKKPLVSGFCRFLSLRLTQNKLEIKQDKGFELFRRGNQRLSRWAKRAMAPTICVIPAVAVCVFFTMSFCIRLALGN